jgi:uncharacterized protein (TIGR03083 family)
MTDTKLPAERYFELIDADTERLLAVAAAGLKAPVPSCPGWDVAEVVWHLAGVYEHKVRVMADDAWPEEWPPADFEDRPEIEFLREAKADLFAEFARHELSEQTTTFSSGDTTIGFWVRRMALEAAVHRYDVELAHQEPTGIPDDLATDGVDELLRVMLAGPWWEDRIQTEHPVDALVAVEAGEQRWLADVRVTSVTISDDPVTSADATVSGDPDAVFLWLWGRVGDDAVAVAGDADLVAQFRARVAECTG